MLNTTNQAEIEIVIATEHHYDWIKERDLHLAVPLIAQKIRQQEIYLLQDQRDGWIGWMRYGFFWDNVPFMNLIWIDEPYRKRGIGGYVVSYWENEMKRQGYKLVMTSTQADEEAQHFYRKLGYRDAGCLLLDTQPLEIMLTKRINE